MADYTDQERAELSRRVNEELATFGRLLGGTQDEVRDAGVGVKGFSSQVRSSTTTVAKSYAELTKQLYSGAQGQAVFNDAIETTTTAVAAFGLLMGGPIVKAVSVALIGLSKAIGLANKQSDDLFSSYNKLAEVGAIAGDQMTGLKNSAADLGYVIADNVEGMKQFEGLIADNADNLALFKGTVFEGRQALAGVGRELLDNRATLRKMGFTYEAQNRGMANYIRLQTTLGEAQKMSYAQLAEGTAKYLSETQALATVTGQTRENVQKEMEQALQQQRFRAKLDELQLSGQHQLVKDFQFAENMLSQLGPEAKDGFQALITGTLDNENAQKLLRSTNGEALRAIEDLNKGLITAPQALQRMYSAMGQTTDQYRKTAQVLDPREYEQILLPYFQTRKAGLYAQSNDLDKAYKEAMKQQEIETKNSEKMLQDQVTAREAQKSTALTMQELISKFVDVAGTLTTGLSNIWKTMSEWALKLTNIVGDTVDYIKYEILKIPKPGEDKAGPTGVVGQQINQQQFAYWKDIANRQGIGAVPEQWRAAIQEEKRTGKAPSFKAPAAPAAAPSTPTSDKTAGTNLDPERMQRYLKGVALTESGGIRDRGAGTSSAVGLYQFLEGTWSGVTGQMGKNWSQSDRTDPTKASQAAAFLTRSNAATFEKTFGRTPSDGELYMMHFLGAPAGIKFLKALATNPNSVAEEVVGKAAADSNPNVFRDKTTGRDRTVGEIYNIQTDKLAGNLTAADIGIYNKHSLNSDVASIPQLALGGIVSGSDSGYLANLHGREAVLPLPNGDSVPITLNIEEIMKSMTASINTASASTAGGGGVMELLSAIRDMVTLQRDQNDLVTQLLHVQRA